MYNVLLNLIEKVEAVGSQVVAVAHDIETTVQLFEYLWKAMGIDPIQTDKVSFKNPCADRKVFVFADIPHMIKLL